MASVWWSREQIYHRSRELGLVQAKVWQLVKFSDYTTMTMESLDN